MRHKASSAVFSSEEMKISKYDDARNNQITVVPAPSEAGPLFPRLHVSDTEKAGPRAPPRNKMALFEQFTVPSHRFIQSQASRTSTGSSYKSQKFDCGQPYKTYHSPVPFSNVVSPHPQALHAASSCLTSVGSDQELQRVFGLQASEKCSFSGVNTRTGNSKLKTSLDDKVNVISDETQKKRSLPMPPIIMQGYASSAFEKICDKFASASCKSAQLAITTTTQHDNSEVNRTGGQMELSMAESEGHSPVKEDVSKVMEICDASQKQRASVKVDVVSANGNCHGCFGFVLEQPCQQPDVKFDKVREEMTQRNDCPVVASNTDLDTTGSKDGHTSSLPGRTKAVQRSAGEHHPDSLGISEGTPKFCPSDGGKQDARLLPEAIPNDKVEITGDSENNQMGSNEVSELSQQAPGRSTEDSLSSILAIRAIRPKDVIHAVGQQLFWKARKALLRQQRIFSDQVFELHKLIKIQQLLAETPCSLLHEEMSFGMVDQCGGSPSPCNVAESEKSKENTRLTASLPSFKDQGNKAGNDPASIENSQWYVAAGNNETGSLPFMGAFGAGGTSAWGYPSFGMGQWMGALPVQGRPSMYQPYTGAFPPPSVGGFYGLAGMTPPSPMVPFCVPYAAHRSDPWEEMSSNHGPSVPAAGSDMRSVPGTLLGQEPPGAWNFVHPSYASSFFAGAPEKNVSTGSGASIGPHSQVRPLQGNGTENSPNAASTAGSFKHFQEKTSGQDENFPRNSASLKSKPSVFMHSVSASRTGGSYHHRTGQSAQKVMSNTYHTVSRSKKDNEVGGRQELHGMGLRLLKSHQNDEASYTSGRPEETTDYPHDLCGNALDLFPVVPSAGSGSGQNSSKPLNNEWQGRVIKAVPHPAVAASQSAAGILLSLQRERRE